MSKIAFIYPGQGHRNVAWDGIFMKTVSRQKDTLMMSVGSLILI